MCSGAGSERCKELLEHAPDGSEPSKPGETSPNEPDDIKPGKPGKGKKKKKSSMEQEIDNLLISKPAWNGKKRVLFRTSEGEWVEIKDVKTWTQKIIQSL